MKILYFIFIVYSALSFGVYMQFYRADIKNVILLSLSMPLKYVYESVFICYRTSQNQNNDFLQLFLTRIKSFPYNTAQLVQQHRKTANVKSINISWEVVSSVALLSVAAVIIFFGYRINPIIHMELLFKLSGIGILLMVFIQVLTQADKKEQAQLITISGVIILLILIVYFMEIF